MMITEQISDIATRIWVGGTKPSYPSTWVRENYNPDLQGSFIAGDPKAFSPKEYNALTYLRAVSRWGWQSTRVIRPNLEALETGRDLKWWQYGWSPSDKSFLDRCKVEIKLTEAIRVLVGPGDLFVYGIGNDNLEVPLVVSEPLSRKDQRYSKLPIF